jgi:hypothetical protein
MALDTLLYTIVKSIYLFCIDDLWEAIRLVLNKYGTDDDETGRSAPSSIRIKSRLEDEAMGHNWFREANEIFVWLLTTGNSPTTILNNEIYGAPALVSIIQSFNVQAVLRQNK